MRHSDIAAIFDREAAAWDTAHGPESPRAGEFRARAGLLRTLCGEFEAPRVLDIGCGTGRQLLDLADCVGGGTGIDLSPAMIARACDNAERMRVGNKIRFQTGDAASPGVDGPFELILFVGALEHAPDPLSALTAARNLLAPAGKIVVIMPHPWSPLVCLSRWIASAPHGPPFRHLPPGALARVAGRAGLSLDAVTGLPYRPFVGWKIGGSAAGKSPLLSGAYAARFHVKTASA